MKILSAAQIREVDRLTSEQAGVSSLQLMENAAQAVVRHLQLDAAPGGQRSFVVLCGKGNNGGDGLAIARLLHERRQGTAVILLADPGSLAPDAAKQWQQWQACHQPTHVVRTQQDWESCRTLLGEAPAVIDAILGVGMRGSVEGLLQHVITDVNRICSRTQPKQVVTVDIPSGLPADTAVAQGTAIRASVTVTFTAPKLGLLLPANAEYVGRLQVEDIGSSASLLPAAALHWIEPTEFRALPLARHSEGHKGDYGHVLVVAGSRGKAGAAALAGLGALHAGAGLVTVAVPENSLMIVAGHAPELMTEPLPETEAGTLSLRCLDYARLEKLQENKSVLAIGPGLGAHPETHELVRKLVATSRLPLILDADGLNAFAGRAAELAHRQTAHLVITPHPGEMARLLGCSTQEVQASRFEIVQEASQRWKCDVVLKGAGTVVATSGQSTYLNTTGNPWIASGGSGDVLTGALAGYVAQFGTSHWEESLCLGVYCHGRAADLALRSANGGPVLASELLPHLRQARHELHSSLIEQAHANQL